MYGLCDCNNFFVSCEKLFAPQLEGKAVVVLSNNDGCVVSRSQEAKDLGVKMGQPFFQLQEMVKSGAITAFSSNYRLYGDMSQRVFETLRQHVPQVEIYSIDEAFLQLDGIPLDSLVTFVQKLVRTVRRNTGIPVSIGIAPTKTLAKIASKLAKKYPRLEGCCLMHREQDIEKVLSTLPIEEVWGIGRQYSRMLRGFAIRTAGDFVRLCQEWVEGKMGKTGLVTWRELRGQESLGFEPQSPQRQSITVSRSFARETTDHQQLHQSVAAFLATACQKLRAQGSQAATLQIFLATNRHKPEQPQHVETALHRFLQPTSSTLEMAPIARRLLAGILRPNHAYKKAGVTLGQITPEGSGQTAMFESPTDPKKQSALMKTIDRVNATHGRQTLRLGSQGSPMANIRKDRISPNYTTNLLEIITVKV